MTPAEIAAQTFQTVRFKEGYDTGEVDEFLAELANGVTVAPSDNKSDTNNVSVATAAAPSVVSSKNNANRFDSGSHSVTGSSSISGEDPFSGGNAQVPW
ncbi:DivIVA domain-containing protein [Bifidobacterium sp. LC6]|uniref:DivIVA domain-containing protein n=1 Tax=Bifidobacterium colobi TaxID=2809026 RepID=A0ABS5UU43_9BIFI|nr:DivIVA domain-containing protein [Bifidobacterium colobi]MBT1174278.1 DivIVA domain-containing protein [Bifidobacterium colobi]